MSTVVARYEPRVETMRAPTRTALVRAVGSAMRRGELGATDLMRPVAGGYEIRVYRVRPARRPARTGLLVGLGVVVVLGGCAAIGWMLVGAVSALLSGISLAAVTVGAVLLWLAYVGIAAGGKSCTITHTRH
jgi:hypothetical protein